MSGLNSLFNYLRLNIYFSGTFFCVEQIESYHKLSVKRLVSIGISQKILSGRTCLFSYLLNTKCESVQQRNYSLNDLRVCGILLNKMVSSFFLGLNVKNGTLITFVRLPGFLFFFEAALSSIAAVITSLLHITLKLRLGR